MSWPTASQCAALIESSGLESSAPADADVAPYLNAAIEEFETRTGWSPALIEPSATDVTLPYEAVTRQNRLSLRTGYQTVVSVQSGGTTVAASNYQLLPPAAVARGRAYTAIQFRAGVAFSDDVVVNGRRGRFAAIPADLFVAVQHRVAALWANDQLTTADVESQQLAKKVKQGPFERENAQSVSDTAAGTLGGRLARWSDDWERAISLYKRLVS